jgi:hypothetical protein
MSASLPIASEWMQRRKLTRCANSNHCRHSPNGIYGTFGHRRSDEERLNPCSRRSS